MRTIQIRVYYNNTYYNYKIDKKIYIDVVECNYYIYIVNNIVYSNFIKEIVFNKLYYDEKYNFAYMFFINGKTRYIQEQIIELSEIVNISDSVCIDLINNTISYDMPIYIENILYEKGELVFNSSIVLCVDIYEFYIGKNFACFSQIGEYRKSNTYFYTDNNSVMIANEMRFKYHFNFSEVFKVFSDSIIKYILPPVLMLIMMALVALVTKRTSMILFMVASSISTVTGSLFMYFSQKNKIKIHNEYVMQTFNDNITSLNSNINKDIKYNYRMTNFTLITQSKLCFGYELKAVDIKCNIADNKLKKIFNSKEFGKYYSSIVFNDVSITGKYSYLYLYNLLLQISKLNLDMEIVFIGEFNNYDFILVSRHYEMISNDVKLEGCIIICNININLDLYLKDNIVIYLNNGSARNVILIETLFKNKIIKCDNISCNKTFYSAIETSKRNLFIYSRKVIYNNSLSYNKNSKGIRLSKNYVLDLEKDGPHGLIVGMTGSGKSVLLLQIILEIATNYSPSEAVIGIIDFKGDALISKVESIPHISSTFSNLNGGYENVIAAIKYELVYRQKIFSKHGISEYNELDIGLPRLFIIIDEFAELKKNLSEIGNEIDSIARVGRSLGIFLIISMQRASGIVSEQLKSNLSYKICLKVNSTQDSLEVINEKTAAFFSRPGEAIVVTSESTYINIYNCLQKQKDDIVINNVNCNEYTVLDYKINNLNNMYNKTDYIIWKVFPNEARGVLLNVASSKQFIEYDFMFSHYMIIGSSCSGKSELVKNIVANSKSYVIYLGNNDELTVAADLAIDNVEHIRVYINYMILTDHNFYFIVDNYELYDDESLNDFIWNCSNNKFKHIKLIISSIFVSNQLSKLVKLFNNKFLFNVNDPIELYNLFYMKYSQCHFELGEGICSFNNQITLFKSYRCKLNRNKKSIVFSNDDIVYLESFNKLDLANSILIYDQLPSYGSLFHSAIYYKDSKNISDEYNIVTNTERFEYKYRKARLIKGMLYDFTNSEDVIVFSELNYKDIE